MANKVIIKSIATYNGHGIKASKAVDLNLKFAYDEMVNYIQAIQMLNENVEIAFKVEGKPKFVGTFMIKELKINHDGEGSIRFNSQLDAVDPEAINEMVGIDAFQVMLKAMILDEEESGEEDGQEE